MNQQMDEIQKLTSREIMGNAETLLVQATVEEIVQRLENDGAFFIEFFIPEELEFEIPQLHLDIWALMSDDQKERVLLAIPRAHAKTTLAKLAVVRHFMFTHHSFGIYLSSTSPIAKNACMDIMNYFQTHNFVSTFGKINKIKESATDGMWIFELPLPGGAMKTCILRAAGAGQQMRGINVYNRRPSFAVVDDVEDLENTATPAAQTKLDEWLFGTFIKALARKKKILWLGNMLRNTTLLSRLSKSPKWNPVVFGCVTVDPATGELVPLWPDLWSLEKIREDFCEYQELGLTETWMCEMMNMPGLGKNGFSAKQFNYAIPPAPDDLAAAFITIDPAFGLIKKEHDRTAIVVHGIRKVGCPMVLAYAVGHMREHEIFNTCLKFAEYWNCGVWGIEAVAAQKVLITLFEMYSSSKGLGHKYEFVPLSAGQEKHGRISAFVSAMEIDSYAMPVGDFVLTNNLLVYDLTKKEQDDDLPDAAAYGPQMVNRYLPMIYAAHARLNQANEIIEHKPRCGRNQCDV